MTNGKRLKEKGNVINVIPSQWFLLDCFNSPVVVSLFGLLPFTG